MRLMNLIALRHLLPMGMRRRWRDRWNRILESEAAVAERRFYRQFINPGDLVFDVGANVGRKAQAWLQLGARVVAVEPNPECVEEIKRRCAPWGESGRLKIESVAAGSAHGNLELHIFPGNSAISSGSSEFVAFVNADGYHVAETICVEVITLDDLIARHGLPAFLKVDVEGMDDQVLEGLTHRPHYLSFEYHMISPFWSKTQRCLEIARNLGFREAKYTLMAEPEFVEYGWTSLDAVCDRILARYPEGRAWGDIIVR